jgi:hypothetical protein
MGFEWRCLLYIALIQRVLVCFHPSEFSVVLNIHRAIREVESSEKKLSVGVTIATLQWKGFCLVELCW